ncbi:unnamed protein product [Psylliodes chrysocephalus]|uniref:Uncharacterized protein n=1 Tax=Psylliodes chrysocephalus TaxID=3402493 RepID=A0A9P0G497_9CUCU|nr:unnamed protein product [Psylliodes chrysocephala]
MNMQVLLKGKVSKTNGENHLHFRKIGILLQVGHSKLHLGNLFQGNGGLGKATNEVVNENSDIFIGEIKPNLEASLSDKFTDIANIICKTFTYEELFPN